MDKIQVVGAIIRHEGKLLAAKRAHNRVLGGYWEFPGGKIEPGETPEAALQREIREEFGAESTVGAKFLVDGDAVLDFGEVLLHVYDVQLDTPVAKTIAHDELRYVNADEAAQLQWAPSDVPVIKALIAEGL